MADKKLMKMPRLEGEIPMFYNRNTIYNMCVTINALASAVDFLAKKVEELEKAKGSEG